MNLKILELFGGIGACSNALKRLNVPFEIVDYVEIDKHAVKSYNAIYETNFEPQDICKWDKNVDVDLIMHGSPCQDFSLAGKQAGGDKGSGTRSSLMYETIRIVGKLKPRYVIWENVKNILSKKHIHNFNAYLGVMEKLGYTNYYQVLNAKDYGIPQNRERVFTISILGNDNFEFPRGNNCSNRIIEHNSNGKHQQDLIQDEEGLCRTIPAGTHRSTPHLLKTVVRSYNFPPKQKLKLKLKDMLEDEVDEKYYISDGLLNNIVSENQAGYLSGGRWDKINESCRRYYKDDGVSPTIHTCQGGNTEPKVSIKNDLRVRKLTPKECWRLMGFQDEDFEKAEKVNSNTQLYKQAGNSIVVNVLMAILTNLLIPGQTTLQDKRLSIYDMRGD